MFPRNVQWRPEPMRFPALRVPPLTHRRPHLHEDRAGDTEAVAQGSEGSWRKRGDSLLWDARGKRGGPGVRSVGATSLSWVSTGGHCPVGDTASLCHSGAPELSPLCFIVVNTGNIESAIVASVGDRAWHQAQPRCGIATATYPERFTFPNRSSRDTSGLLGPHFWRAEAQ